MENAPESLPCCVLLCFGAGNFQSKATGCAACAAGGVAGNDNAACAAVSGRDNSAVWCLSMAAFPCGNAVFGDQGDRHAGGGVFWMPAFPEPYGQSGACLCFRGANPAYDSHMVCEL